MLEKLKICLFQPRRIALYSTEKLIRGFFLIAMLSIVVTIPLSILLYNQSEFDSSFQDTVKNEFYNNTTESEITITNGILSTDNTLIIQTEFYDVVIWDSSEELVDISTGYPLIVFAEDQVIVCMATYVTVELLSVSYEELGLVDLDFSTMYNNDSEEINKFLTVLNSVYSELKPITDPLFTLSFFIQYIFYFLFNVLLYTAITFMVNPLVKFKMRFKICLDCQVVYAASILLCILYSASWIETIGLLVSGVYIFFALSSIVGVKIKNR